MSTVEGGLREVPIATPVLTSDELRGLAIQAVLLPNILSKSQIEQLGLAVLTHLRRVEAVGAGGTRRSPRLDQPYRLVAIEEM